ncbi:MAG: hypothetical protein AAFY64_07675 [Pseudomonadota bacterium]
MVGFVSDFLVMFGVIAAVLVVYGWRAGWFLGDLADQASRQGSFGTAKVSGAKDQAGAGESGPADARKRRAGLHRTSRPAIAPPPIPDASGDTASQLRAASASVRSSDDPRTSLPEAANDRELSDTPADVHPAVRAAAKESGTIAANGVFPDHWSEDQINARPGWMLFDVRDILGEPIARFTYDVPGARKQAELMMFPIEDVRHAEREHMLIEASRRKVITARWQKRKAARSNRGAA